MTARSRPSETFGTASTYSATSVSIVMKRNRTVPAGDHGAGVRAEGHGDRVGARGLRVDADVRRERVGRCHHDHVVGQVLRPQHAGQRARGLRLARIGGDVGEGQVQGADEAADVLAVQPAVDDLARVDRVVADVGADQRVVRHLVGADRVVGDVDPGEALVGNRARADGADRQPVAGHRPGRQVDAGQRAVGDVDRADRGGRQLAHAPHGGGAQIGEGDRAVGDLLGRDAVALERLLRFSRAAEGDEQR